MAPKNEHPDTVGLTTEEAKERIARDGYNEVAEQPDPEWKKIVKRYLGLVPLIMLLTALISVSVVAECDEPDLEAKGFTPDCECAEDRDWVSFALLIFELNLIVWVDYFGERSSSNAIAALKKLSAPTCQCKRDGKWTQVEVRELVVGDVVELVGGSIVPCDGKLVGEGEPIQLDESSLTGESLPVTRRVGDEVLSGGVVVQGELEALVTATGADTFVGKSIVLMQSVKQQGNIQKLLGFVAKSMSLGASLVLVVLFFVMLVRDEAPVDQAIKLCFVILVAVLPVAMPVVVTTGLAVGALELSREQAIVQRLSAIEEFAGMDILCSDKTGTLTKNILEIFMDEIKGFEGATTEEILRISSLAAKKANQDAIDKAVTQSCENMGVTEEGFEVTRFIPFNPVDKVTKAFVTGPKNKRFIASKGAPSVMRDLPGVSAATREAANEVILAMAERGLRAVGVAVSYNDGASWKLLGYIAIFDPPRHDTGDTIREAQARGVEVKMITGDQRAIAVETARQLDLGINIIGNEIWSGDQTLAMAAGGLGKLAEEASGFAGVFPEHKFKIVESLQQESHVVGMTGDGVNDAPALKRANVGIAVAGATDAAKSAADIVLTAPGLSTIVTALNRSRKIFKRLEAYITYRLASSCLILGFFFLSVVVLKFNFPTWTLILLSIVNDFTVMATSKDHVRSSKEPLNWQMGKLLVISGVVGGLCIVQSFLLLWLSLADRRDWWHVWGIDTLPDCEVVAVMYLNLSISIQLNIFSVRNRSIFCFTSEKVNGSPPPSIALVIPVAGSIIFAYIVAAYWPGDVKLGGGAPMAGCGWGPAGVVTLWAIGWFLVIDLAKVVTYDIMENEDVTAVFYSNFLTKLLVGNVKDAAAPEPERAPRASQTDERRRMSVSAFERGGGLRGHKNELLRVGSAQQPLSSLVDGNMPTGIATSTPGLSTIQMQIEALTHTQGRLLEAVQKLLKKTGLDRQVKLE